MGEKVIVNLVRDHSGRKKDFSDHMRIRTDYPSQSLKVWIGRDIKETNDPVLDVWLCYTPLDAEQHTNRTYGYLSVKKPPVPGLIHAVWPAVVWFTENIFREDKEIVEFEQRAYDAQGADWNNEVFPALRDLRACWPAAVVRSAVEVSRHLAVAASGTLGVQRCSLARRRFSFGASEPLLIMDSVFSRLAPWNNIRGQLATLLHDELEHPKFLVRLECLCGQISQLMDQDTDGSIFAVMRFDHSDYAVIHSLQTAVICDAYGIVSDWSIQERLSAIGAGLTMNIAMLDLQQQMHAQREPPTPERREAIRTHPTRGRDRLESLGLRDELWLRMVVEHHETPDGTGYPTGTMVPLPNAAALGLADRYSAKISRRLYRAALAPDTAIRELYQMYPGRARDSIDRMVQAVGLYPPGTFVELANGETAVVATRPGPQHSPRVYALLNAQLAELKPVARDTAQRAFAIKGAAGPISMGATARLPKLVAEAARHL